MKIKIDYTSYDDEDEDEDEDNILAQRHSYQYSRSVTPDVSAFNNTDNEPSTPPESNNNLSILAIKLSGSALRNNNRAQSNASSKASVASESQHLIMPLT